MFAFLSHLITSKKLKNLKKRNLHPMSTPIVTMTGFLKFLKKKIKDELLLENIISILL